MAAQLNIQLTESTLARLTLAADAAGQSPPELVAAVVERAFGERDAVMPEPGQRGQLMKLFGSLDMGRPVGIDNDAIDADLAREYEAPTGSR